MTQAVTTKAPESKAMEYLPFGATDKIKLSIEIVKNYIAVRTRSGQTCSDRDATRFMMLCMARRLNPFEGDAFLIGFDTKNGAQFNLVTAHQAYLKRAELHPEYDGMKSGIVIDGPQEIESEIVPDGNQVVGGWATVYFKNRKIPMTKRIPLSRFAKLVKQQSEYGGPWRDDPAGQIVKCAEADALRSSFPTLLGGLYMREEVDIFGKNDFASAPDLANAKLVDVHSVEPQEEKAEAEAGLAPTPNQGASPPRQIQEDLSNALDGVSFDDFRDFAGSQLISELKATGTNLENAGSFLELPTAFCEAAMKNATALARCVRTFRKKA